MPTLPRHLPTVRTVLLAALLATGLLAACAGVNPVTASRSGLMTGPGGAADAATGGQANAPHSGDMR